MRFSFHTHTNFCDGKAGAEAMAQAAFEEGYALLGFSSHAPLPFDTEWTMKRKDLPAYGEAVMAQRFRWESRGMKVLLGLEVDFIPGLSGPASSDFSPLSLDFILGSIHYLTGYGDEMFAVDEGAEEFADHLLAAGGDGDRVWKGYYLGLARMIQEGGFDILGHFDLVKKNNARGRWFDEGSKAYLDAAFQAVDLAGERGCVAEINTGGIARGKIAEPYPSMEILRRMRGAGVRLTLGDDAHSPGHLGKYQALAAEAAAEAGFESLWYLEGKGRWREISLGEVLGSFPVSHPSGRIAP